MEKEIRPLDHQPRYPLSSPKYGTKPGADMNASYLLTAASSEDWYG